MRTGQIDTGSKLRERLGTGLLLLVSFVLSSAAGEYLLRTYRPIRGFIYQLDDRYIYKNRPNSRRMYIHVKENGGQKVLVAINEEGRRGAPLSSKRPDRIAVFGDSYIAGEFSPLEETFAWQLESLVNKDRAKPFHVVNAGVSGYGPDQASLVIEDQLALISPRLLVMAIYPANDFGDLIRNKLYKLDAQKALIRNFPRISDQLQKEFHEAEDWPSLQILRAIRNEREKRASTGSAPAVSGEVSVLSTSLTANLHDFQNYIIEGDPNVYNWEWDQYDGDVSCTPDSEAAQYKRLLMERVLERIARTCEAHGVPLLLLIIPGPMDIINGYPNQPDPGVYPQYKRQALTDMVQKMAEAHHIANINLFPAFEKQGAKDLYFATNEHWNRNGQRLAARIVHDYLLQNGLLPRP